MGPLKSGRLVQVIILQNKFIKQPQTKFAILARFLVFILTVTGL